MKTRLTKLLTLLLAVIIFTLALPLSASAGGWADEWTLENATAETVVDFLGTEYAVLSDSKTVKLIKDVEVYAKAIDGFASDITIDFNGYKFTNAWFSITDANGYTLTLKDKTGKGGVESSFIFDISVDNLIIDGGIYKNVGSITNVGDLHYSESHPALIIEKTKNVKILAGEFYGGDIPSGIESICEKENCGIQIGNLDIDGYLDIEIDNFQIFNNVIIKGGNGTDNYVGGAGIHIYGGDVVKGTIEINGAQISGGNGKVGGDAIYSEGKISAKITDATLRGGTTGGKEINVADGSKVEIINNKPVAPLNTAINIEKDGIKVSAENGVFPAETEIKINKISSGDNLNLIKQSLSNSSKKITAFEIVATCKGSAVQPNGKVTVTFTVPKDYDMQYAALYYIPKSGKPERLSVKKDTKNHTLTVTLDHFSTYVVTEETSKSPQTGYGMVGYIFIMISSLVFCFFATKRIIKN